MNSSADDGGIASYYIHLLLSILAIISFWCQSIVTEERLVPALNVLGEDKTYFQRAIV